MTEPVRLVSTPGPTTGSSLITLVSQTVVAGRHPGMETEFCFPGIPDKRGESSRAFAEQPPLCTCVPAATSRGSAEVCCGPAESPAKQGSSISKPPVSLPPPPCEESHLLHRQLLAAGCGLRNPCPPLHADTHELDLFSQRESGITRARGGGQGDHCQEHGLAQLFFQKWLQTPGPISAWLSGSSGD